MREETIKEMQELYAHLGINFDSYNGEAYYEDKLEEALNLLEQKNLLEEGREGARIVQLEDEGLGTALLQKKDGATLYMTRDLAALKDRASKNYDQIFYVVAATQNHHFKQLFCIAKKADILKNSTPYHISFGMMSMPEGGMSTRKGKVVFAWKVLETAVEKAKQVIHDKGSEVKDKETLAKIVGIGAVKYAVLSQNRARDVKFTWEKMLSLEGNSAPYIMYAFARALSILAKANLQGQSLQILQGLSLQGEEMDLLRKLYLFPEVVERSAQDFQPSDITTFVFELARTFNTFYNKIPVLNAEAEEQEFRLALVKGTAQVLKNGMDLLGIELPEKM